VAIDRVGVVGAGLMGSEIALAFALAGKDVLLSDVSEDNLKRALDNLGKVLDKGAQRRFYPAEQKAPTLARIRTTTQLQTVKYPVKLLSNRPFRWGQS
jgi:3-hydroxybutyryl-CoA dehydrogenase